jgi:cellulose synthase (UDP-forming)
MVRRSDHRLEADRYECRLRATNDLPTVDVFIATCNEELAILRRTIEAASRLDYPHHLLRIIVGDDGARPELQHLAMGLGVDYLARPTSRGRKGKVGGSGKAGNDRYAFANSHGDFIVLLDADFCVRPEFLHRTLGFLLYRRGTGLVQTPQRFSNADVIGHNLGARSYVPEDQHFFMSITESCRDAWGNAFCTGTACVVSRRALRMLDPVWGFPHYTICEDLELTYALMEKGYRTLYLNEPLAFGLAPESIPDFLKQRVRWCAGTVQNLYAPTGPIRGNHRLIDRIFYLEGVFYWLGSLFAVMLIFAPVVFWFTGVSAVLGTPEAAAAAVFPRLIARELTMFWLSEGKVPPMVVQVSRAR